MSENYNIRLLLTKLFGDVTSTEFYYIKFASKYDGREKIRKECISYIEQYESYWKHCEELDDLRQKRKKEGVPDRENSLMYLYENYDKLVDKKLVDIKLSWYQRLKKFLCKLL